MVLLKSRRRDKEGTKYGKIVIKFMGTRRKMFVIVIRWPTNYVWGFLFDFYSFLIIFTNSSYRKSAEKEIIRISDTVKSLTDFFYVDTHRFFLLESKLRHSNFLRVGTLKYRIIKTHLISCWQEKIY
jgi:hypothetical protein